jgi:hypothetical protein
MADYVTEMKPTGGPIAAGRVLELPTLSGLQADHFSLFDSASKGGVSEKEKRNVVPRSFWYLSIVGATVVLAYAIHRNDPNFIVGNSIGLAVYRRNLPHIHHAH